MLELSPGQKEAPNSVDTTRSNFLAFMPGATTYGAAVKKAIDTIARQHLGAFVVETLLFVAFYASFLFIATLRTPASNWALLPHVLCIGAVFVLAAKHMHEDRPALYWSGYDLVVLLLFSWFALNVYYSEVRAVSWRVAALYLDALAAYLFGRMLFAHRLRSYVIGLLVTFTLAYALAFLLHQRLVLAPEGNELMLERVDQLMRIVRLLGVFLLLALPFLLVSKPSNLLFLLFAALALGVYVLVVAQRLGWLFQPPWVSSAIDMRHERFLTLQTAWRIVRNYPWTGCGLGTFPILFDAYKPSPALSYGTGFNAYLYSLAETGLVGLLLLLVMYLRFPLFIIRHWKLFPNRRLRMAVFVFLCLTLMIFLQGLYDADMFTPGAWFIIWANMGVLMSLVMVRDPVRLFDTLFYTKHALVASPSRRLSMPGTRGALANSRKPQMVLKWILAPLAMRDARQLALLGALLAVVLAAVAAPYMAEQMTRQPAAASAESPGASVAYGKRILRAARIFPLLPETWSKLGDFYQQQVKDPLEIYHYKQAIEDAYLRAIELNPYEPASYEQLAYLYNETNAPTQALAILKQGVRNNPNHFVLRMLLVKELEKMGSLALATYHVKQALFRIDPDQVKLYVRLAELYERRGMRDRALSYYQYAKQVVPDTDDTAMRLRRLRERLQVGEGNSRTVSSPALQR